ncbi:MAG TPA: T9SS type A sorting domain-containing protein [bacterium]|nr:T9SS type A sorting domain-containing protein [bacterium]
MEKNDQHRSENIRRRAGFALICGWICVSALQGAPIIIDHLCTDITRIPEASINQAKSSLHIAYGHTSHGSQITDGMTGLVAFANGGGKGLSLANNIFQWNNGGTGGALDLHDYAMGGDVGYYPDWVNNTRTYLDNPANADVNVIIWSWCGQASGYTEQQMIDRYLAPMTQLETDYPDVTFVYMTGHADGTGLTGNLHLRNQQIRDYCVANNKVLFDFYDIECYDPDGDYYGDKSVNDNCDYDSDGNGSRDANWAVQWQNSHIQNVDWYSCGSAHSQPLNANQKAYAAWWLWAALGGWDTSLSVHMGTISASQNRSGEIVIRWTTQSETDCAGFHVWRSTERNGDYIRLTTQWISAHGNSSEKHVYEFTDRNVEKEIGYWYRIEEISTFGESEFFDPIRSRWTLGVPAEFGLDQNYPNPFNPSTALTYRLAEPCRVDMRIVDVSGRVVRTLVHAFQEANQYTVTWDGADDHGRDVTGGVYLVTLKAGEWADVRKMTLIR